LPHEQLFGVTCLFLWYLQAKLAQLFSDMASEEFTNSQLDSVRGAPASAIPASKAD
jgi:hypothetical protein